MAGLIQATKETNTNAGLLQNHRVAELGDFEINLVGRIGEEACAQYLGVPLRRNILTFGDGGSDLIVNGQSAQVKTNHRRYEEVKPYLNNVDELKADWLIWCGLHSPATICIYGFISKEKFVRQCVEHNFGYGPRVCVREDDLTGIDRFIEATKWKLKEIA